MTLALILFVLFYILMLAVQQYRPWVALGGAGMFLLLGSWACTISRWRTPPGPWTSMFC